MIRYFKGLRRSLPQISIILSLLHRDLSRQKRAATLEALSDPPLEKWFPADEGKRGVIFSFISSERGSEPKQACFLAPLDSPLSAPAIPFGGRSRSVGAHAPTLSGNCNVLISTERVRPSVRPSVLLRRRSHCRRRVAGGACFRLPSSILQCSPSSSSDVLSIYRTKQKYSTLRGKCIKRSRNEPRSKSTMESWIVAAAVVAGGA